MSAALGAQARFGRATLVSMGIHLLVALLIPALAWTSSAGAPVETISFTHILHIQVTPPRPVQHARRALAPRHSLRPQITFVTSARTVALSPHRHASPAPMALHAAPAAPAMATVSQTGEGSSNGVAQTNVTPPPQARAVASVGTHQVAGYMPFGAQQPDPVLNPDVKKQLDALGVHVTLLVTVGDDGRTENVVFTPTLDPAMETRIRSLLADAAWDPAVCGGGVSCEGHATIKL
ncbi:MAG: hypothetical protein JO078_02465 [Candidatus Eremiobacteraeota bacterium]|nr:hypothetical protein [Candidatus Eremiobacteraeota bacterium]MBV9055293.1 hypothetical protein [Candidatus Eremiobacteraeota bacterium]MBV9698967.1 hypothetical protein [Candidatus Eremiobacteraeota bacterium]